MTDELRAEYKRSDLGRLVRGKYAQRVAEATNRKRKPPRRTRRSSRGKKD
jgi:hypothetical protein